MDGKYRGETCLSFVPGLSRYYSIGKWYFICYSTSIDLSEDGRYELFFMHTVYSFHKPENFHSFKTLQGLNTHTQKKSIT